MARKMQVPREVWRITERRGGATYRTEFVEVRWVDLEQAMDDSRPDGDPDLIWASYSEGPPFRWVEED